MSSLKNAVKRSTHKERAQPVRRKKLGILEKKKDYLVRARDHHRKRDALGRLHRKADARNPDEFYFKMIGKKTKDGVHVIEKENVSDDVVKLVRSQNMNYLKVNESAEAARIRKMHESLHFLVSNTDESRNTHTIFLSDEEEADNFNKTEYFDTTEGFVDRTFNRPRKSLLANHSLLVSGTRDAVKNAVKEREKLYTELDQRIERHGKMRQALNYMETYKNLEGKGQRYKVKDSEGGRPPIYKWKQERKT